MKSLTSLWKVLAHDMGERCSVDTNRDYETVTVRTREEGTSFLTITLPAFGKAFEKWLEEGQISLNDLTGFRSRQGLPVFLSGFLRLIFDSVDGALLSTVSADAVLAIRQLCGVYGKMHLQASPERTLDAMRKYLEVDDEVQQLENTWDLDGDPDLSRVFDLLFGRVCDRVNREIDHYALLPKHGPGSTADRKVGNQKWVPTEWHERLEPFFPSVDYLLPSPRYYTALGSVNFIGPGSESPVRVISVPKTQKTPRIIAMEPTCMQYAQQAVSSSLTKAIESDSIAQWFVRFSDQEPNQVLAREGSLTGVLATLDLSEASDRVSNELVLKLLNKWSHLNGAVQACRSRQALVRIGDVSVKRDIAKFASMGSALCFPIEAMVFATVVFRGIEKSLNRRLSQAEILQFANQVSVYGDDIIVPVDHVGSVVHELVSFGFKVNSHKSFWNGKFRESCGKDYYAGTDVSFVKFRRMWPNDRHCVEEVVSLVSFFNQVKDMHYTQTTSYLRKEIALILGGHFPRVTRESEILGEFDDVETDIIGMCSKTHRPLSKGYVLKSHIPVNRLDDHWALLKWFLKEGEDPFDRDHLLRSGRSSAVSIKLRKAYT